MNIAILGKGTSSLITAIVCLLRGHNVSVYYDPNKEYLSVGESTTPHFANLLRNAFGICIHDLVDANLASFKTGIKFVNWGKGKTFKHPFANNAMAFHFLTKDLNPFVVNLLESKGVKFYPQRVDSYTDNSNTVNVNGKEYDFLISCVGWADSCDYKQPFVETVNSAVTFTKSEVDSDLVYTIHKATEDGWEFGLPFPQRGITKCGYLFNNNFINVDAVKQKLKNYDVKSTWEWKPRYCKSLIQSEFVAYNGNRLFFFEPLQALSLYYTFRFADLICNYLDNKSERVKTKINCNYLFEIHQYQQTISWHYRYGSSFETPYWRNVVEKSNDFLHSTSSGDLDIYMNLLKSDKSYKDTDFSTVGIFSYRDMDYIISGMTS